MAKQEFEYSRHGTTTLTAGLDVVTGLIVFYGYIIEVFFGWYSADTYEHYVTFENRMFGPYAGTYWALIFCNGIVPQLLVQERKTKRP